MFEQDVFEQWLEEEAAKVSEKLKNKETSLNLEDKIILTLKAQANHFYHLDLELRDEIRKNNDKIDTLKTEIKQKFIEIDKKFDNIDKKFDNIDKKIDKKFDILQSSITDLYKVVSGQTWKILGTIGLIVVLGKIIDKIPF